MKKKTKKCPNVIPKPGDIVEDDNTLFIVCKVILYRDGTFLAYDENDNEICEEWFSKQKEKTITVWSKK